MSAPAALQSAASEARKAARAAREFAALLDEYAKYLTQPSWQERADELHQAALKRFAVVNDGLATCAKWVAASSAGEVAQPVKQSAAARKGKGKAQPEAMVAAKPAAVRVVKRGSKQ